MEWSSIYITGIDKIDKEHKFLFDLIAQLKKATKNGAGEEKIHSTLANLVKYVKIHFKNEEIYMDIIGYPELDVHKKIHREFIIKVKDLIERYRANEGVTVNELYILLVKWLQEHIAGSDQKYVKYR